MPTGRKRAAPRCAVTLHRPTLGGSSSNIKVAVPARAAARSFCRAIIMASSPGRASRPLAPDMAPSSKIRATTQFVSVCDGLQLAPLVRDRLVGRGDAKIDGDALVDVGPAHHRRIRDCAHITDCQLRPPKGPGADHRRGRQPAFRPYLPAPAPAACTLRGFPVSSRQFASPCARPLRS